MAISFNIFKIHRQDAKVAKKVNGFDMKTIFATREKKRPAMP